MTRPQTPFPLGETKLLLLCRINLEKIQEQGKDFPWQRPGACPACGGARVWGHGFVLRYFFGYGEGLWMKRWRCPDCGGVHTSRPPEYTPGIQYRRDLQIRSLQAKLSGLPFLSEISRQVQQHWQKLFERLCRRHANWSDRQSVLDHLCLTGQFHLTKRRIYRKSHPEAAPPYLPFALTTKRPSFSLE